MREKEMTVYGKRVELDRLPNGMVVNRNLGEKMQGLGTTMPTDLFTGNVNLFGQEIPYWMLGVGGVLVVVMLMSGGGGE